MFAFAISMGMLTILYLILSRTRFGRAIRATVQNPVSAALLGIDGRQIAALGFGLSVATAAAAGAVYGLVFPFHLGNHYELILRLFAGRNLGYQFRRAFMHTLFESSRQLGKSRPLGRQLLQARSRLILSPTAAERRSDHTG